MYKNFVKRIIDLLIALLVLLITLPLILLAFIVLFFANQGSPFFVQKRPGKGGRIFNIIKFKTMNDAKDKNGHLLPDAARLTAVGKLIRKMSIDELPQLINVLKGDMSLIGPRPLLTEYLPLYSEFQMRRHEVKPGITGWSQVNGRNALSWLERFEMDVWYVDHISFALDLRIIFITILKVVKSDGISGEGTQTMEKFKGN